MTLIQQLEARGKALKVQEVAKLFEISKQHVYEMAADGSMPAFHVGRSIRFDPQELADWLRKRKPETGKRLRFIESSAQ
jgi:excisionase family DNA binding protein